MLEIIFIASYLFALSRTKYVEIPASGNWVQHAGTWSSFSLSIGEPQQDVEFLPSASTPCLVPLSESVCSTSDCLDAERVSFQEKASSSWTDLRTTGSIPISFNSRWNISGRSFYGTDHLFVHQNSQMAPLLDEAVVAPTTSSVSDLEYGACGLIGTLQNVFKVNDVEYSSIIEGLKQNNLISSRAWSYTAGAHALQLVGSFVFGGFDQTRRDERKVLNALKNVTSPENLNVTVHNIVRDNDTAGLLSDSIDMYINPDIPQIWLPGDACDRIERALNLTWNQELNLYPLDDFQKSTLSESNRSLIFSLSSNTTSSDLIDINLPYSFLQMNISLNDSIHSYFAVRKASNPSQYVLGRAFLQAAHLTVNFENATFQLSAAVFPTSAARPQFRTIGAEDADNQVDAGVIIGAVLGGLVGVIIVIGGSWYLWHRRKGEMTEELTEDITELPSHKAELETATTTAPPAYRRRLMSDGTVSSEMDGADSMLVSRLGTLHRTTEDPVMKSVVSPVELEGSIPYPAELDGGFNGVEKAADERQTTALVPEEFRRR